MKRTNFYLVDKSSCLFGSKVFATSADIRALRLASELADTAGLEYRKEQRLERRKEHYRSNI